MVSWMATSGLPGPPGGFGVEGVEGGRWKVVGVEVSFFFEG